MPKTPISRRQFVAATLVTAGASVADPGVAASSPAPGSAIAGPLGPFDTMRETIDIALREYVSKPDYDAVLKLSGMGTIDSDYDPKAGDRPAAQVAEAAAAYSAGKPVRRRPARR